MTNVGVETVDAESLPRLYDAHARDLHRYLARRLWILDRETGDVLELRETTGNTESITTTTYGTTDDMNKPPAH